MYDYLLLISIFTLVIHKLVKICINNISFYKMIIGNELNEP